MSGVLREGGDVSGVLGEGGEEVEVCVVRLRSCWFCECSRIAHIVSTTSSITPYSVYVQYCTHSV